MIFNILDNTTELWMTKYIIGEIFSSSGATLHKNSSDQTVTESDLLNTYSYHVHLHLIQTTCQYHQRLAHLFLYNVNLLKYIYI